MQNSVSPVYRPLLGGGEGSVDQHLLLGRQRELHVHLQSSEEKGSQDLQGEGGRNCAFPTRHQYY